MRHTCLTSLPTTNHSVFPYSFPLKRRISTSSTVSIFISYVRHYFTQVTLSDVPTMSVTAQQTESWGWYSGNIVHHSVPVPGLTHLEAAAVQLILAGRPVKILATYLSPSRPLIGMVLTACFGWGLPFLMAGDLNPKHVDWNSRLTTRRGNPYVITPTRTRV